MNFGEKIRLISKPFFVSDCKDKTLFLSGNFILQLFKFLFYKFILFDNPKSKN